MDHDIALHEKIVGAHESHLATLRWKAEAAAECAPDYREACGAVEHTATIVQLLVQEAHATCAGCRHDFVIRRELRNLARNA